jgi:hypothetical protein
MLPARHFTRAILLRSLVIWVGVRAAATGAKNAIPPDLAMPRVSPWELTPAGSVGVVVVVVVLVLLDAARRHELLFLANLGVKRVAVGGLAASLAAVAELLVAVAVAA